MCSHLGDALFRAAGEEGTMRTVTQPATVYCGGRLYVLRPEQWQRLRALVKGLKGETLARVGQFFLVQEGIIKEKVGD